MSQEQRVIGWEKWNDPFGSDDIITVAELMEKLQLNMPDEESFDKKRVSLWQRAIPVIQTPMGIVPLTENTRISEIFNFWVMHTNFKITQNVLDALINKIDGVEAVDVFTPYRARLAFGKLFNSSEVKRRIQEYFGCTTNKNIDDPEIQNE